MKRIKTIPIYMIFLAMGLIDSARPMVSLAIALTGLTIPILSGMQGHMIVDGTSMMQFYKILFAQSMITVGSSMGFLLPVLLLHAFGVDWSILFPVFSCIISVSFAGLNTINYFPGNGRSTWI